MNTSKLTLSIPKKLLLTAKTYSRKSHQPLSRLVSRYFEALAQEVDNSNVSSRVLKVTGLAKSSKKDQELLLEAFGKKYHL